jgi:hypothetical protein
MMSNRDCTPFLGRMENLENILKKRIEVFNHLKESGENIENMCVEPFTGGRDDDGTKHVIFHFRPFAKMRNASLQTDSDFIQTVDADIQTDSDSVKTDKLKNLKRFFHF